jgi:hypothetical protein
MRFASIALIALVGFFLVTPASAKHKPRPKIDGYLICGPDGSGMYNCFSPEEQCDGKTENLDICNKSYLWQVQPMTPPIKLIGPITPYYRGTDNHYIRCSNPSTTLLKSDYHADGPFPVNPFQDWAYVYGQCGQKAVPASSHH